MGRVSGRRLVFFALPARCPPNVQEVFTFWAIDFFMAGLKRLGKPFSRCCSMAVLSRTSPRRSKRINSKLWRSCGSRAYAQTRQSWGKESVSEWPKSQRTRNKAFVGSMPYSSNKWRRLFLRLLWVGFSRIFSSMTALMKSADETTRGIA